MAINSCVLEVDSRGAVSTDDELQLWEEGSGFILTTLWRQYFIVPAVGTSPNLDPVG